MNITTLESQLRRITWVSTSQYTQAEFLEDINVVKDEFWSWIVARLDEDSNYEEWTTDTVSLESEYTMPTVAYNTAGAKILKSVAISYNWETYNETWLIQYKKAREVNKDTLQYEWNYYVENQDENYPIYFIADNSYFIAPAPRTAWTNYLKLTGIRKIPDYTITTTESEMKIPADFQRVLLWGVIPYALMSKRVDNNEISKAQSDYLREKTQALQDMSTRKEWPVFMTYPDTIINDEITITRN